MVGLNFLLVLSSPKSVVGNPEVKPWIPANNPRESRQEWQLCPKQVEGLLLCINTKKSKRKIEINEENTFRDLVTETADFYNCEEL